MTFLYKGDQITLDAGTTFLEAADRFRQDYDALIILARVGHKLVELNRTVPEDSGSGGDVPELSFVTTRDRDGHKTYERGATMMFLRAMNRVLGRRIDVLKLEYAIGDGFYFTVRLKGGAEITEEQLAEVQSTMERYVRDDEKFVKETLSTEEAIRIFREHGMTDKERLFHYRISSYTNVYRLGNYVDYYYGYMPPSTGCLSRFYLRRLDGGVLMVLPNRSTPGEPGKPDIPQKLFATMRRTNSWGENIGVSSVAELNDTIARGGGRDVILASESYQEHIIGEIARRIKAENRRIVLISGPSSSGKTSFSHRLSVQLKNVGIKAHPIACDNYYVERSLTPRDENGQYDFERLDALNLELLNDHMTALLRGETVELPTFNFRTGIPEFNGNRLSIGSDEVLVMEGIHGLNEQMSYSVRPEDKFKIYVSAITALNIDEHNRIPTTDNREIRRMVRDARTRGFSAKDTISRWMSVRKGEECHIFPFQEDSDVTFNSAMVYELAVLKTFAQPLLFSISPYEPEYTEAKRLLKFLDYFLALSCEDVPRNSLIREFIGDSIFPVG